MLLVAMLVSRRAPGQIAVSHRIRLVEEENWMPEGRLPACLNYAMLLRPDPNAAAWQPIRLMLHRTAGGNHAGVALPCPAFIAIMGLSYI